MADIASSHVTISPSRSTVIAQGSGIVVVLVCGMLIPVGGIALPFHSLSATLSLLVGLGLLGGLGYLSLYRAFQTILPVGLVSCLVAFNSAVSTLLSWFVFRDVNLASVLLLLCGVVLVAGNVSGEVKDIRTDQLLETSLTPANLAGMGWAMIASLCLGGFNFGLFLASEQTSAWYILLLGSRAVSLLGLSFVLAGLPDNGKDHSSWTNNIALSVGVGIAQMLGLLGLCISAQVAASGLSMILVLASCSVLLPFG